MFSLSSASSNATIPVTLRTVVEKIGESKLVAGFGVPLGATMNMSGAAIYTIVAKSEGELETPVEASIVAIKNEQLISELGINNFTTN